MKVGDIG